MKTIRLKIKELVGGGFFTNGHGIVCPVLDDGKKEQELGDYTITSSTDLYELNEKLLKVRTEYKALGYKPVGEWEIK